MRIFITGAAGLIGSDLVAKLLRDGHSVVGLVRSNNEIYANDGQKLAAKSIGNILPQPGELVTVQGDVIKIGLEIVENIHELLSGHIDLVIHCAALTAFDAQPDVQQAINVKGTENTLSLFPNARFLHVSTAYTCGAQNGVIPETLHSPDTIFQNGYEKSKAAAEALVAASGRDYVIARPSIVIGEYETGQIKAFDTIYAVFRLIAHGLIPAIPASDHATLDFVPIDHVIGGLIDIVNNWHAATNQIFHLSSARPVTPQMLIDAIGSFEQLSKPNLISSKDFSAADLPPRSRRLYNRTAVHYASYFDRNPRFENNNLEKLSGRTCPEIDGAALRRMIDFCISTGFLGNR